MARSHLRRADPVLRRLVDADPEFDPRAWLTELPPLDCFRTLLFQVVGQQLSITATRRILERIGHSFGGHLPDPAEVINAPGDVLRSTGFSERKVRTVRSIAALFADGTLSDQRLRESPDQEILTLLTAISGIGPWTVHGFLIIALNRPDVVLPGDLALRKAIQYQYALDHLPTPDEVLDIAEPWRPHRSLATAYLFQSAFKGQL